MKAFKKLSTARKHYEALKNSTPSKLEEDSRIIGVGGVYIVGANCLTEITVLDDDCFITGHITAKHLDRLGNANWAEAKQPINRSAF